VNLRDIPEAGASRLGNTARDFGQETGTMTARSSLQRRGAIREAARRLCGAAFALACGALAVLGPRFAWATEGGGSAYPYGLNTVATGVLPKPGHYLYSYNSYYTAKETTTDDGDVAPVPFDVNVRAHTLRYLGVHPTARVFGGSVGWLVAQPFLVGDASIGSREAYDSGLADAALGLMLGWHGPARHSMVGVDLHVPNGAYDAGRLFNPGRNYWATTLYYALTVNFGGRYDANLRTNLTLNDRNADTHYRSGHEVGADGSLNARVTPKVLVGLGGYWHQQVTDDELRGERVPVDGRRLRVVGFGPQAGYRGDGWGITAKWQHEDLARNKAQGDKYWLQVFVAF
jgi:hypothetical protein